MCKATVEDSQKLYLSRSVWSLQNVFKEDHLLREELFFCVIQERLKADIRTSYVWLTKSHEDQIKTEEEVKQAITVLSQMCAVDEHDLTDLDRLVKRLQGAVQQELKEFMAFPLHLLDNITLPS